MAAGGRDRTSERDQLREKLQKQGRTLEQIAAAMADQFEDRLRAAWRNAHGWTQDDVAARFNEMVGDQQASVAGSRISDYERWPIGGGGCKPTPETLAILADIYGTTLSELVDDHDRQNMTPRELASLAALVKQTSASKTHYARLPLAYAAIVEIPQQLPIAASCFVGRDRELDMLTTQLDNAGEGSPVVVTAIGGTAGIGKTVLAVHWTQKNINRFPDGQLYVDLRGFDPSGTPMTPHEAIRGFLDAFHTPVEKIPTSLDAQAVLYRNLVENKKLVLVLDNARDTDQVRPLLPGSPTCLVLVTSRQQLSSLTREGATHITLSFLSTEEARQLLIEILGPERIDAEPDAVEELIQRCVHLPIALHIAAARIKTEPHTSLGVLVGQLREQRRRLAALSTGDSQFTDIRAVFSWSYTALSPGAARLFRFLGLHPGPDIATLAVASLVGLPESDTHELLTELLRASLLEEPTHRRYRFHDLLSAYASQQAHIEEAEPQQQKALHRVLDYYLHTGFTANRHLHPHRNLITLDVPQLGVIPDQFIDHKQAMNWFTAERAVLLSATNYAATHGFDTHAWQLPWTLAIFLNRRGHWHDWAATQQNAVTAAARLGDQAAQALAHRELGYAHTRLECCTDALANLQRALALYEALGDRDGQATTHHQLGLAYWGQRQHDQALTHAQQALDLFYVTGNQYGQAYALNNVGWYYTLLGQYQQTLTYCQQALNLNRELDDLFGEASTLDSIGYAHYHLGHHDQAITHYQRALALRQELGYHYGEAETLNHLGDAYHAARNIAGAREAWQQALAILEQLGHHHAEQVRAKLATLDTDPDERTTGDQR